MIYIYLVCIICAYFLGNILGGVQAEILLEKNPQPVKKALSYTPADFNIPNSTSKKKVYNSKALAVVSDYQIVSKPTIKDFYY